MFPKLLPGVRSRLGPGNAAVHTDSPCALELCVTVTLLAIMLLAQPGIPTGAATFLVHSHLTT